MVHRIEGRSMAPTLWGVHVVVECGHCGFEWKVDVAVTPKASHRCPHCGESLKSCQISEPQPPDTVTLRQASDLRFGQLVAIRKDGRLQIKRLVALPGDRLTLDGLRLLVNGGRIEDRLHRLPSPAPPASIVVDEDFRRALSRWIPLRSETTWVRTSEHQWIQQAGSSDDWLRYNHRSVHDHNQPAPIMDDYPGNLDVQRRLFPVDRLVLEGVAEAAAPIKMIVAVWARHRSWSSVLDIDGETPFRVSFEHVEPTDELPVNERQPIAVRMEGECKLRKLSVLRHLEYRLRMGDDAWQQAKTIPRDSVYVLGDNVPLSVDSRDYGPVPVTDIVGVVE
jgi:hypothetical protein